MIDYDLIYEIFVQIINNIIREEAEAVEED